MMRRRIAGLLSLFVLAGVCPPSSLSQDVVVFVSDRDGNREIYSMQSDGRRQVNLSQHRGKDQAPALSPDRKQIAWISDRSGQVAIWRMAVNGSAKKLVRETPDADFGLAWSPDGRELAVTLQSGDNGTHDIAVLEIDSGRLRRLTDTPSVEEITPAWNKDGDELFYIAGSGSATSLMRRHLKTGDRSVVVSGLPRAGFPVVSPNGTEILVRSRTDQFDVLRIKLETGTIENLTEHNANDWGGVWSPDGGSIFFASDRDGDMEIYALDLVSRRLKQLTKNENRDWTPSL